MLKIVGLAGLGYLGKIHLRLIAEIKEYELSGVFTISIKIYVIHLLISMR